MASPKGAVPENAAMDPVEANPESQGTASLEPPVTPTKSTAVLPDRTPEDFVAEIAADYAPYVQVGDNEHLQNAMATLAEDVNHSLARLEEFAGLVNQINADTESFLEGSIPLLHSKCEELRATYARITQLEAFVGMVKRNVQQMDDHVTAVERSFMLQPLRAITGKITTLFKMASSEGDATPPPPEAPASTVPKIFKTKDFFKDGRATATPASPRAESAPAPPEAPS